MVEWAAGSFVLFFLLLQKLDVPLPERFFFYNFKVVFIYKKHHHL